MADPSNPFEAFGTPGDASVDEHRQLLSQTRPWLTFLGILTLLGAVLMLLGGLMIGVATGLGSDSELEALGTAVFLAMLAFYGVLGLIYGGFAYLMLKQATAIGRLRDGGGLDALATVLRAHRDFWRFAGITTVVFMMLYCGGIVMMTAFGLQSTFSDVAQHIQ